MAVNFKLLRSNTASKRPQASSLAVGELGLNYSDTTSGLFFENNSGNVMKVGPAEVSSTAPNASPAAGGSAGNSLGELWYDTTSSDPQLKIYTGSAFVLAGPKGIVSAADGTAITINSSEQCTFAAAATFQNDLTVGDGDLILGSTAVTSTAAEINVLDGVTAGTIAASKAVVVDSNKDVTGFRNVTLTGDLTVPEGDLILGSAAVTSTAAELNLVDGITAGTVSASKAVIVDSNKDIASFRNVTLTGELDTATLDVSSTSAFADTVTLENQKEIRLSEGSGNGTNYTGFRAPAALTADVTFTLPDGDGTNGQVVTTDGSGTLSWATQSGGVDGISSSANATAITIGSNEQCTFSQSMILQGDDLTSEAALDVKVLDNSALALRIMEAGNEYMRVVTTDGSESITIKKALHCDAVFEVDNGVTLADQTNIQIADNSGFAFRVREGTSEYMRFTTTDGGEKIVTKKTLEIDGALDIDGAVDCSGQVTFTGAQTISVTDNLGFALRVMEGSNEYVRFTTTDDGELVDFTKTVKLDGGMTLGGGIDVPASQDITMVTGNSNAIDFTISGGNRMMRFNTSSETVLLEQNFEVDGTATFDGAMDIDSTMDISGGDVTFSANADIHIPDNSGQALDIAEAGNTYVRFITTDDSEKIEVSKKVDLNAEVNISEDIYLDGASSNQIHLPSNFQYGLEIRDPNTPYFTIDTRSSGLGCLFSSKVTLSSTLTFDSVTLSAVQTSAETFADNDTSVMTSAAVKDLVDTVSGVSQTEGTFTATFRGSTGEPGSLVTTTGYYVQIGKMVTVTVDTGAVSWTGYAGNFSVTGLPATAKSGYDFVGSFVSSGAVFESGNNDGLVAHIDGNTTVVDVRAQDGNNASVTWSASGTDTINFTITYFTA